MGYCPELVKPALRLQPRRRRYPRQSLRSLAYVTLDRGNGGIIRDLTEFGVRVQAVAPLLADQEVNLRFELLSPRVRVDVHARVQWADSNGQGGIQFIGLTPRMQRALRDWLFIQMLATAAICGRSSIFAAEPDPELMFSASARPVIAMAAALPPVMVELPCVTWRGLSLSARIFSIFVDTLVLLCAVLLFSVSSIALMGGMPALPLALALFLTASTIFLAVYQLLFSDLLCGATPGARLAMLASTRPAQEEETQRFR